MHTKKYWFLIPSKSKIEVGGSRRSDYILIYINAWKTSVENKMFDHDNDDEDLKALKLVVEGAPRDVWSAEKATPTMTRHNTGGSPPQAPPLSPISKTIMFSRVKLKKDW